MYYSLFLNDTSSPNIFTGVNSIESHPSIFNLTLRSSNYLHCPQAYSPTRVPHYQLHHVFVLSRVFILRLRHTVTPIRILCHFLRRFLRHHYSQSPNLELPAKLVRGISSSCLYIVNAPGADVASWPMAVVLRISALGPVSWSRPRERNTTALIAWLVGRLGRAEEGSSEK